MIRVCRDARGSTHDEIGQGRYALLAAGGVHDLDVVYCRGSLIHLSAPVTIPALRWLVTLPAGNLWLAAYT